MSAKKATSELTVERPVGSGKKDFYTITTHENSKPTNTEIKMSIDKSTYDSYQLEGGKAAELSNERDGKYYVTVRNGGIDTIYADLDVRKTLADTGNNSLTTVLNDRSIDALTLQFTEDQQGSKKSFWQNFYSPFDNVAKSPDEVQPPGIAENFAIDEIKIEVKDRRKKYENLFYPEDIVSSKQDKVRFTMFFQGGSRIGFDLNSKNPFKIGKKIQTNIEGSVTLPIQGGIGDQNEVSYNTSTLNPVTGALASVALNPQAAVQNLIDVFRGDTDIQAALRSQEATNTIGALRLYLAQQAVGASGLIPRTTGAILNPNLELILQSPSLRSFNFTFSMSARSRTEATQIKKIIRFFKQGMSVKRSDTSLFVVSPNMFRIQYLTSTDGNISIDHPSIGKIKDCALTAINTEYTPDGTYMTFDDEARTMTSYRINMQFTELEPLTETDYIETAAREDSIGY